MNIFRFLLAFLWIAWSLYWQISNKRAGGEKNIRDNYWWLKNNWWVGASVWIIIIALVLLFLYIPVLHHFAFSESSFIHPNPYVSSIGIFITVFGQALTIWARVYLGKSWNTPMTLNEKTKLITTGPYTFVRHPIYAGMIIAMLGTVFVIAIFWIIPCVLLSAFVIYSLKIEERDMMRQFPKEYKEYKEYKKRTKALIPFIY